MLYVRSELNLGLDASELAGLVERHGVRAVEDVVSGLGTARRRKKVCWSFSFGESSSRNRSSDKQISRS